MKRIISTILTISLALSVCCRASGERLKGRVTDTDGAPVAGVSVSDGLDIVQTDKNGKFYLESDEDSRFVFISTPSGYRSSVTPGKTSYFHKIEKGRNSYEFILERKTKDDTNHNLIVIADPQISDADEFPELEVHAKDIGAHVRTLDGDDTFGLVLGDIVGWNHTLYPTYDKVMENAGIEFRKVMGNHDMTNYGRSHETSMDNYQDHFGPAWYSFNAGKIHYIVLNDNYFIGRDWYYIGYLDERQLRWLGKDLATVRKGSRVIVSLHIPTTLSEEDRKGFDYRGISEILCNKKALYELLSPYKALILSGHMHTSNNQVINENLMEQNIAGMCGAWWCGPVCIDGSPIGYKVFEIDGEDIRWHYQASGMPSDYQMKVYAGDPELEGWIVANVWDYDPMWKVEYFEDGVKVCDMERFKGQDLFAKAIYSDPSKLKRSWVYAAPTENLFRAKPSENTVNRLVRVTDRFGRVYTEDIVISR